MKEKEKSCSVPQCQGKWDQGRALSTLGLSLPQQGVSFLPLKGLGKGIFELSGVEVTAVSKKEDLRPLEMGILESYKVAYSYT